MAEWRLYKPVMDRFTQQGFHVVSQVTDPNGTRWEIDVAAYTPELDDVRLIEAKQTATQALVAQCLDRLQMAPRVYAAVPDAHADAMHDLLENPDPHNPQAQALGLITIDERHATIRREPTPTPNARQPHRARRLEDVLRGHLAQS